MNLRKFLLYNLVFFSLSLAKAEFNTQPFHFESAQDLAQDLAHDLAQSKTWLQLNFYQKSGSGWKSRIQKPFFLHPEGFHNPVLEFTELLTKTLFSSPEVRKATQCATPARTHWLRSELERKKLLSKSDPLWELCETDHWVQKLNPQSMSLVFASADMNSVPSSFGHTFLRLHTQDENLSLLDYGVNFAARTEDVKGALYAWYGLLGYFPGTFGLAPYHHLIKEYVSLEGRDLWEYDLNLSKDEIYFLVLLLLEYEKSYFDYYFLDENCSSQILRLLEVVRPDLKLISEEELFVIPLDTVKTITRTPGLVLGKKMSPSRQTEFLSRLQKWQKDATPETKNDVANLAQTIAESQTLPDFKKRSTEELELLQSWTSLLQAKDYKKFEPAQYALSTERASRSGTANFSIDKDLIETPDPTLSADSSQVSLGVGEMNEKSYVSLSLRPAFKDEFSLLQLEVRKFETTTTLESFEILNITNAVPINLFQSELSWGLRMGIYRAHLTEKTLVGDVSVKLGKAISFFEINKAEARFFFVGERSGFGPEFSYWQFFGREKKWRTGLTIKETYVDKIVEESVTGALTYAFLPQLQIGIEQSYLQEKKIERDLKLQVTSNFIF